MVCSPFAEARGRASVRGLLKLRIRPEGGRVDIVIEGVGSPLLHVVVEEPGDHLALVERVFLKRNEFMKTPFL